MSKPISGKRYRLTGESGTPCIANGNTWQESEVRIGLKEGPVPSDLRSWLADNAPLAIRDDVVAACAIRGKRAGRVLASVPTSKGPRVVGAWRALMAELAPTRAGLFSMLFCDEAEREAYDATEEWLSSDANRGPIAFRVGTVVRLAGGSPLEFGLLHWHISESKVRELAAAVGISADACGAEWLAR